MVPPSSHKVPRVSWYSGYRSLSYGFRVHGSHALWPAFPKQFPYPLSHLSRSEPGNARITVWASPLSLAATHRIEFSFSSCGYLDGSVPRVPFIQLCIYCMIPWLFHGEFPHSDISGSLAMCASPKLFAAYHVLHRLLVPRHPPCALCSFVFFHC